MCFEIQIFINPYVDSMAEFPVDFVYTGRELDTIDWYKANFESTVSENEVREDCYDKSDFA